MLAAGGLVSLLMLANFEIPFDQRSHLTLLLLLLLHRCKKREEDD